jgi:propionyl-CoA synthetase
MVGSNRHQSHQKKEDPDGEFIKQYDLSALKIILAGERCDNATYGMVQQHIPIPN